VLIEKPFWKSKKLAKPAPIQYNISVVLGCQKNNTEEALREVQFRAGNLLC